MRKTNLQRIGQEELQYYNRRMFFKAMGYTNADLAHALCDKLAEYINPIKSLYIHQRCYPGRATVKYQLPPIMGIPVYDMAADTWTQQSLDPRRLCLRNVVRSSVLKGNNPFQDIVRFISY